VSLGKLGTTRRIAARITEELRLPRSENRLTARELLVCLVLLLAHASLVYGKYVAQGGFHSDDWAIAAAYALAPDPRYLQTVSLLADINGGRPLLSFLAPLPHAIFGARQGLHLGNAIALGVLVSLLLYCLLRTIGFQRIHAGVIAAVALVFPWSDGVRFWATAGVTNIAICFFLLGATVAILGLARSGWRAAAIHAVAVALYVMSALTYEVAAGAAMLSGGLYLTRAPWSAVRFRWLVDAVAVGAAIGYSAVVTSRVRYVPPIPYKVKVAPQDTCEALSVLASSFIPAGADSAVAQLVVLALMFLVLALVARRRLRARLEAVRPWLILGALALVWLIGAYTITLGALHPLDPGANNRGNMFAALGFAMLVYALIASLASLVRPSWGPRLPLLAVGATALIAVGYIDRVQRDEALWLDAQHRQKDVLAAIEKLGRPERGTTIYAFGFPGHVASAVPVFAYSWDLEGAVRLMWNDRSLGAYPIQGRRQLTCESRYVSPRGFLLGPEHAASYPSAVFIDVTKDGSFRPRDQAACRAALARLRPAPWELTETRSRCPIADVAERAADRFL
jgi:hypothetical protein